LRPKCQAENEGQPQKRKNLKLRFDNAEQQTCT
jgi:hypothetical protein